MSIEGVSTNKMDNVSRERLEKVFSSKHLDLNLCIKSKIFPAKREKPKNRFNSFFTPSTEKSFATYHPLKTYFDLGYFTLVLPFRFVKDELFQYRLHATSPRKV